jgi:hypothetical protein
MVKLAVERKPAKSEMLKNSFQFDYHTLNALGIRRQSGSGQRKTKDGKLCPSTR